MVQSPDAAQHEADTSHGKDRGTQPAREEDEGDIRQQVSGGGTGKLTVDVEQDIGEADTEQGGACQDEQQPAFDM